jgi:hypothetical protein
MNLLTRLPKRRWDLVQTVSSHNILKRRFKVWFFASFHPVLKGTVSRDGGRDKAMEW